MYEIPIWIDKTMFWRLFHVNVGRDYASGGPCEQSNFESPFRVLQPESRH